MPEDDVLFGSEKEARQHAAMEAAIERERLAIASIPELQRMGIAHENRMKGLETAFALLKRDRDDLARKVNTLESQVGGLQKQIQKLKEIDEPEDTVPQFPPPPKLEPHRFALHSCRRCSEDIYWTKTPNGKNMPVEVAWTTGRQIVNADEPRYQLQGYQTTRGINENGRYLTIAYMANLPKDRTPQHGEVRIHETHFIRCKPD